MYIPDNLNKKNLVHCLSKINEELLTEKILLKVKAEAVQTTPWSYKCREDATLKAII